MKARSKQGREEFARSGGLIGGPERAKKLTKKRRQDIAKKAAAVRWAKKREGK